MKQRWGGLQQAPARPATVCIPLMLQPATCCCLASTFPLRCWQKRLFDNQAQNCSWQHEQRAGEQGQQGSTRGSDRGESRPGAGQA